MTGKDFVTPEERTGIPKLCHDLVELVRQLFVMWAIAFLICHLLTEVHYVYS